MFKIVPKRYHLLRNWEWSTADSSGRNAIPTSITVDCWTPPAGFLKDSRCMSDAYAKAARVNGLDDTVISGTGGRDHLKCPLGQG